MGLPLSPVAVDDAISRMVAAALWKHGAVQVRRTPPFQLSSGNFTPLYVNCRLLISYPSTRSLITAAAQWVCHERDLRADCVAGGETAGMPFGAWLADRLDKPYVYVRKKRKAHGTEGRVEGVPRGEILLFEDLITDGGSKLSFIDGIRDAGCTISNCLVIVDREEGGRAGLAAVGVDLHSLVTISTCLEAGYASGALAADDLADVKEYLAGPAAWHEKRGLAFLSPGAQPVKSHA
jgi:orotate phosphoribosyltransferase